MSFASINGVTLHYRVSGPKDGMPLILANSLGTDSRTWDDVLAVLEPRHRVLTYDKRGHGLSDAPPGPYRLDAHVADLIGLADKVGFTRFNLAGVSVGGMIAMRVAARYPQRVRALVLCDTAPAIGTLQMWNERIRLVREGGMKAIASGVLERWVSPGFRARRPTEFAGWLNLLERCSPEGYMGTCATVRDANLLADLEDIIAPTLVVTGEHDVSTPPEVGRELADLIADAKFRLVRGAGHVPSIEQPDALAQIFNEHFNEVVDA